MFEVRNKEAKKKLLTLLGVSIINFEMWILVIKEAIKLYYMHYWYLVVIFYNMCLSKSAFSTYYFLKLLFRFYVFYAFSVCFGFSIWCFIHRIDNI